MGQYQSTGGRGGENITPLRTYNKDAIVSLFVVIDENRRNRCSRSGGGGGKNLFEEQEKEYTLQSDRLFDLLDINQTGILEQNEAVCYLLELYDYVSTKKILINTKEDQVQEWLDTFGENRTISRAGFQRSVDCVFPTKASNTQATGIFDTIAKLFDKPNIEDDWHAINIPSSENNSQIIELTIQQISNLTNKAENLKKDPFFRVDTVRTYYYNSLVLCVNLISEVEKTREAGISIYRLQRLRNVIEAKLSELEKIVLITALPPRSLVMICYYLEGDAFHNLSCCSHFLHHACKHIKPCLEYTEEIDYKILSSQISGEISEFMTFLPRELHIQIFSFLDLSDILPVRSVCKQLQVLVDEMIHSEFESMHLKNFYKLKDKLQSMDDHEKAATEVSGWIGDTLINGAINVVDKGRGVGLVIALGLIVVGGLIKLEATAGGPISGGIGQAVGKVKMRSTDSKYTNQITSSNECTACQKPFTKVVIDRFTLGKVQCRACRQTFCENCCNNIISIPVHTTSYDVSICDSCYKLIRENDSTTTKDDPSLQQK